MPLLLCPNDNNQMLKVSRSGVEIDVCPTCSGVWLDRGELNKLLAAEQEHANAAHQAQERFQEEVRSFERDPDDWKKSRTYDPDKKRYRYAGDSDDDHENRGGHGGHKGRGRRGRLSLLDLFD